MSFTLPALPYTYDALEPAFDARTMEIHHTKHHQTYVNNLNAALEGHADLAAKSIEDLVANLKDLPESIQTAVRNNGGGHFNHSFFWESLQAPSAEAAIPASLKSRLEADFGSVEAFKEAFAKAMGTGIGKLSFQDLEVLNDEKGAPYFSQAPFSGKIWLSISHTEQYATASVILEESHENKST